MSMLHTDAVFFEDDKAFEAWLINNASTAGHVWIRMAKKGSGVTSIDLAATYVPTCETPTPVSGSCKKRSMARGQTRNRPLSSKPLDS